MLFLLYCFTGNAQNKLHFKSQEDSLLYYCETGSDTSRIDAMISAYWFYSNRDFPKAKNIIEKAVALAQRANNDLRLAQVVNSYASVLMKEGNHDLAIINYSKALRIYKKHKIKERIAAVEYNIGDTYQDLSEFDVALKHLLIALRIDEEIKNTSGIAADYNIIGSNYYLMGKTELAIENYTTAKKYFEKLNNNDGIAQTLHNIGNCKANQNKYDEAIELYKKSLEIHQKLQNNSYIANCYNSLGSTYANKKDFKQAKANFNRYLQVSLSTGEKREQCIARLNLAQVCFDMNEFDSSYYYTRTGLAISKSYPNIQEALFHHLSNLYVKIKKSDSALFAYKEYFRIHDSIYNENSSKNLNELQSRYKRDKVLLKKDAQLNASKIKALEQEAGHRFTRNIFIVGISIVLIITLVILYGYRQKRKSNIQLEEKNKIILSQKHEVEVQKEIVEEKQKEILDSIHYAKRIQKALLTSEKYISNYLNDYFILYKPKDIVSGDFYWALNHENRFLIAACDCTGHGVPGAFMSLLNISFLNETVIEKNITRPNEILNSVRKLIIQSLNTDGNENGKDGMDSTVLNFEIKNNEIINVDFAMANNPIWIFKNQKMIEFTPDKMPVGNHGGELKSFTFHSEKLEKNDLIYIFTDGYADQFGGPKGKKFKYSNLAKLLSEIQLLPMPEQKKKLNHEFENWRGSLEQLDDVCIIGIRV